MRTQEQALRAYYASMDDVELLNTAANRASFIEVAQRLLGEELVRRHLTSEAGSPASPAPGGSSKLEGKVHHAFGH
jgi:hypothetical protein